MDENIGKCKLQIKNLSVSAGNMKKNEAEDDDVLEIKEEYKEEDFIYKAKPSEKTIVHEQPQKKLRFQDFPEYKLFKKLEEEEENEEVNFLFILKRKKYNILMKLYRKEKKNNLKKKNQKRK